MLILTFFLLPFPCFLLAKSGIKEYSLKYLIQENEPIGRMVGTIATDIEGAGFIHAVYDSLIFKLSGPNCCFHIDNKSSVLTIENNVDLESICQNPDLLPDCSTGQGNLDLTVNLWSRVELLAVVRVRISILDVNDNVPQFHKLKIERRVSEASHKSGRSIYLETATDSDIAPENARIEYGLSEYNPTFQLRVDASRQPFLLLLHDLDAENHTRYKLKVRAWNAQDHKLWNELLVDIIVMDFNDNPPKFNLSVFSVMVKENTRANTAIFQLIATDPDSSSVLRFDLHPLANLEIRRLFSVLENGTVIVVSRGLDYERHQKYQVPVRVTDELYDASAVLEVLVEDENDEKPEFIQNPSVLEVGENEESGLIIGQITVTDKDGTHTNGQLLCNYDDHEAGLTFRQSSTKSKKNLVYDIQTKKSFDREKAPQVIMAIICSDGWNATANVHLTSSFTVTVNILDKNDNAPHFKQSQYTAHVMENSPSGTPILEVNADDLDGGLNGKFLYLLDGDLSVFHIESATGVITVQGSLDREMKDKYRISVQAIDNGSAPLTGSATIIIIIDDINDNTPCLLPPFEFTVLENAGPRFIGQLRHEDNDIGPNAEVTFSKLWSGDDPISVSDNGTLCATRSLDRETKDRYCLQVRLRDNGLTGRRQSSGEVCVRVIDVNDNKPRLINPRGLIENESAMTPVLSQSLSLSIYESPGYVITQLVAVDDDESINAKIAYQIKLPDNLPSRIFSLNASSGQLILAKPLNPQNIGHYSINVYATDSGTPALVDEKILHISITNKPPNEENKSKTSLHGSWVDRNSLLVVIILSSISLSFIAMLVTAIVCMLKPCYQRNPNPYDKEWMKKFPPKRPGSLKTERTQDNISGSLQENLLINGSSEISSSFLNTCLESNIDIKPYPNLDNQVYSENDQIGYISSSTLQRCHGSLMGTLKNPVSRIDYGLCSQCPIMSNYGSHAYATFGHYVDTNNEDEIKEDMQSDSGRGASEDDASRTNVIRLKRNGQTSTFKNCSSERGDVNIPMATLSGKIDSGGGSVCQQIPPSNNYTHPDVLCDEINQLFFHNLIKP